MTALTVLSAFAAGMTVTGGLYWLDDSKAVAAIHFLLFVLNAAFVIGDMT